MEDYKLTILKTLYSQQQSTAHTLRERMSRIAAATISLFIAIDGWIIINANKLTGSQLWMLIICTAILIGVSIYAVYSRYKEFSAVTSMIVRIERAMKIYTIGEFLEDEPLYSLEHMDLGKDEYAHSKNIFYSHALTIFIFGTLSIALGLTGLVSTST